MSETVWITTNASTKRKYHEDKDCEQLPDDYDKITDKTKLQLKGFYPSCSYCCEEYEPRTHRSNQAEYECSECGSIKSLGKTGARALHPCHECNDMTSWDRMERVR